MVFENLLKIFVVSLTCMFVTHHSVAETRLYGGTGQNPLFLGCFGGSCGLNHPSSICNVKGRYGSQSSSLSIWNTHSFYGNKYRKTSLWNKGAMGLIMTDSSRMFLGRLNITQTNPTNITSQILAEFYSESNNSLLETQLKFCDSVVSNHQ